MIAPLALAVLLQADPDVGTLIEQLERKMLRLADTIAPSEPERAERLRRGAALLRERWAAGRAREAVEEWRRGNPDNALRHGDSVVASLGRLLDILEGREKRPPEAHRTPEEALVELETELRRLLERQKALDADVRAEDGLPLTRERRMRFLELAESQRAIAGTVDELRRPLAAENLAVLAYALERIGDDTSGLADRIAAGEAGRETRTAQDEVVRKIEELLEAIRRKRAEAAAANAGRGGDGGSGPRKRLPPVAELELITSMQEDVYRRTRKADGSDAVLRRLSDEQGKIAELMKDLIETMEK